MPSAPKTLYDPLRRKEVAATPEERERQWFIAVLEQSFRVPRHQMMSEVQMHFGSKPWRADILVYDRRQEPLVIVECKREEVEIDAAVLEQALRYHAVLHAPYLFLTNGRSTCLYRRRGDAVTPLDHIPSYEEMVASAAANA